MDFDFTGWTLVFDLDGTLVETAPDLHAALNHTLATKGLAPVSLDSIRMIIGDGAKALIRKGLNHNEHPIDEDEIDSDLWPTFIDHYLSNITRLSEPFEGAVDCLINLKASGATLAVCTNKAQNLAEEVLNGLNLAQHFSSIVGGDALPTKKPAGEHIIETVRRAGGQTDKTIMIGDAQTDEVAAYDAQLPYVFVSFGYGNYSGESKTPTRSIDHWRELRQALVCLAKPD
jgi:phosphoglycolate phosphatase